MINTKWFMIKWDNRPNKPEMVQVEWDTARPVLNGGVGWYAVSLRPLNVLDLIVEATE